MPQLTQNTRFEALDAMRGVAAIMVVWFHSSLVNGSRPALVAPGNIYVDFFFILSGFVIAHAYLEKISAGLGFGWFVWSRLARIWPLHLFMIVLSVIYDAAQNWLFLYHAIGDGANPKNTGFDLLCNVLLIHSLGILDGLSWNYPSWSISVEFYTYLIFFLFIAWHGPHIRTLMIITGMAYAVLIIISVIQNKNTILASYDFGLIRAVGGFFGGVALYRLAPKLHWPKTNQGANILQLGTAGITVLLLIHADGSRLFEALTIAVFFPLILCLAMTKGILSRCLTATPMLWLGKISYSIYLGHALLLSVAGFGVRKLLDQPVIYDMTGRRIIDTPWATPINLIIICIVIIIASITYQWIERPAQKAMLSWGRRRWSAERC